MFIKEKSVSVTYLNDENQPAEVSIGLNNTYEKHGRINYNSFNYHIDLTPMAEALGQDDFAKLFNAVDNLKFSNEKGLPCNAYQLTIFYVISLKNKDGKHKIEDLMKLLRINEEAAQIIIDEAPEARGRAIKDYARVYLFSQRERFQAEADAVFDIINEINAKLQNNIAA